MRVPSNRGARRQRGAITLIVALTLLGAMLLVLASANRALLLELRMSGNQVRSTAAFEAADAGLAWAEALLNSPARIGADCRAASGGAGSFREHVLAADDGRLVPRRWDRAGVPVPRRAACAHGHAGWRCSCPADADPEVGDADDDDAAFLLEFLPDARPGVLRLRATGCDRARGACRADGTGRAAASARHELQLALQGAIVQPPAAALALRAPALDADSFFAGHFGLSKSAWQAQPIVRTLECSGDCTTALADATAAEPAQDLFRIDGDLLLRGPAALGTPQRPLLIVASGAIRLEGALQLHGVLYGQGVSWDGGGAKVRGALLSETDASGAGPLDLERDAAVLEALRTRSGSLVRLPGSWRDF